MSNDDRKYLATEMLRQRLIEHGYVFANSPHVMRPVAQHDIDRLQPNNTIGSGGIFTLLASDGKIYKDEDAIAAKVALTPDKTRPLTNKDIQKYNRRSTHNNNRSSRKPIYR